ncbi:diacylglycerol/lipid kinase family protein [Polymorphum gilvum]|uniref:Putative Diacylglycerol kinase catalytic domain protein n=1 Tax=Polymorphum gilvum (strain LMG 25793 / CGMCC 1.9160 / SL003B-26A1) TaxID=991905 RepID=F2IZ83_POLGS|nr:diacylglycerol kinase family protein [Polymorphum gilvum]ADZ71806.1 Putative Diacylglycerol kinase catalytic domain protein [Polymorphum gilvum SL003B-26A1]
MSALRKRAAIVADRTDRRDDHPIALEARKVLIVANPTSGGYRPRFLDAVRAHLAAGGCEVEVRLTTRAGEIGEICADPRLAVGILAVAGGDGSVNEAITGFQSNPMPPDLAVIPFGTANVLAHELGLPTSAEGLARMMLRRKTAPLHYGLANGRPFVLMASAGFDAEVVHAVPLALKRRLGKLAYVITALRLAFTRKGRDLEATADGERIVCRLAVATNGRCYGGPFTVCPDASVSRPGLHLLALEKDGPLSALRFGLALLLGRVHKARGVRLRPFAHLRIASTHAVPAQVDGDPFGRTPVEITAAPDALSILVP